MNPITASLFDFQIDSKTDSSFNFSFYIRKYFVLHGDRDISEWMDNQDVCLLLNISPRTLQTLRDNGTLAYSQISHKTYYKPKDVERILPLVEDRRKQAVYKEKKL